MSAEEEPAEDIPAWFMTYSDVITLLMTFFILLLTFSTTEPEKFERVTRSVMGSDSATGIAGIEHSHIDHDSWLERIRPRAARIALHGSEVPPVETNNAKGEGLLAPDEEESKFDEMQCYEMLVKAERLSIDGKILTEWGRGFIRQIARQTQALPIHFNFEFSSRQSSEIALLTTSHLIDDIGVRPGQLGLAYSPYVASDTIQIVIERYEVTNE